MLLAEIVIYAPDITVSLLAVVVLPVVNMIGSAEDDMVVDVPMVGVGRNDVGMPALQKPVRKLLSDLVDLICSYLSGSKRLYQVERLVWVRLVRMRQREFEVVCGSFRRRGKRRNIQAAVSFFGVADVLYCSRYGCLDTESKLASI